MLMFQVLVACASFQVGQEPGVGPLEYRDPQNRFELRLPGTWAKDDEPPFPCQAMYVEFTDGLFLSLHVRKVPAGADVKTAAKQDSIRWAKLKNWKVAAEEEKSEGGTSFLVQKATLTLVDEESPEDAEAAVIRLVHAVLQETHVTVAILAEVGRDTVLDAMTGRVLKALKPVGAAGGASKSAGGAAAGERSGGEPSKSEPAIDPKELEKLDPETRAAILKLMEQQKSGGQEERDVDERVPINPREPGPSGPASTFTPPAGATVLDPLPAAFVIPQGWRIGEKQRDTVLLVSDVEPGMIIVHVGVYRSFDGCYADLSKGFAILKLTGQATDGPREESVAGLSGTAAAYQGQAQDGTPIAARYRAALGRGGLCLAVCGITTPDQMSKQAPRVDEIARSFQLGELLPDQRAMAALVGQWSRYRGSSSGSQSSSSGGTSSSSFASFTFGADGSYSYSSESSLSVTGAATSEGTQGSAFSSSNDQDQGAFLVVKNLLILTSAKGGSEIYELRLESNRMSLGDVVYVR